MKRTHQPKKRQRVKVHGFRARMSTTGGVKVIKARRRKARHLLTPTAIRRARQATVQRRRASLWIAASDFSNRLTSNAPCAPAAGLPPHTSPCL